MSEAVKFALIVALRREIQPLLEDCQPVDYSPSFGLPDIYRSARRCSQQAAGRGRVPSTDACAFCRVRL